MRTGVISVLCLNGRNKPLGTVVAASYERVKKLDSVNYYAPNGITSECTLLKTSLFRYNTVVTPN